MAKKNLTQYLLKPLELEAGDITLVSPVPSVEKGKQLTILTERGQQLLDGDESAADYQIHGIETVEDMARYIFTKESVDAALKAGISLPDLTNFITYAMAYWVMGEEAADAYMQAISEANDPKGQSPRKP